MQLLLGKMEDRLKELGDNSVDSVVTDPPYGISFMGKGWDHGVPDASMWKEVFRVLKPGGHVVSFSSARTYHRSTVAIEDAGFEIRDQLMWVYATGFPAGSTDLGKATDKKLGRERVVTSTETVPDMRGSKTTSIGGSIDRGTMEHSYTSGDGKFEGWGTRLKPAHEPITLARKPISEKTITANCIKWGLGGININASRLPDENRWPANFLHDGCFDQDGWGKFFYVPKVSKKDRNEGMSPDASKLMTIGGTDIKYKETRVETHSTQGMDSRTLFDLKAKELAAAGILANTHPTVKPTDLMHYLIRLVTPTGGVVLDPFMGSGSTGKAAIRFDYDFIGIEMEQASYDVAKVRIEHEQ